MFSYEKDESQDAILHCTYSIHDPAVGLWHVTNLLSILVDVSMESVTSHDPTPAFQDYLAWMLDSFLMAHDLQKRWKANPILHEACKKSEVMSFCSVHAFLSSLAEFLTESMLRKGYILLSALCADLLESPADLSDKSIHLNLCSSILNLVAVCEKHHSLRRVISLHLLPAIEACLLDEMTCSTLGNDFQVCLPLPSPRPLVLTDIRKQVDPSARFVGLIHRRS
jgi:serine/threonine-protein kinase ATR